MYKWLVIYTSGYYEIVEGDDLMDVHQNMTMGSDVVSVTRLNA